MFVRECLEFGGPRCLVQYAASVLDVDVTHFRACSQGHLACLINTIRALIVRIGRLGAFYYQNSNGSCPGPIHRVKRLYASGPSSPISPKTINRFRV